MQHFLIPSCDPDNPTTTKRCTTSNHRYGEKLVKGSPCPRSYYKCSHGGCPAKKIVERDAVTNAVLSTQYKDEHNHAMPGQPRVVVRTQRAAKPQMLLMVRGAVATPGWRGECVAGLRTLSPSSRSSCATASALTPLPTPAPTN